MAPVRSLLLAAGALHEVAAIEQLCSNYSTADSIAKDQQLTLAGETVIVTGSDGGLGFALAETLATSGARVIVSGHNRAKVESAAANITASAQAAGTRGSAVGIPVDLGSFDSVRAFYKEFMSLNDKPSLKMLFNNAGVSGDGNAQWQTADGFEWVYEVDYLGPFLLTELLLPLLREAGPGARVVNTASTGHIQACSGIAEPEDCLKDWKFIPTPVSNKTIPSPFDPSIRVNVSGYGLAKFSQIQHMAELADREAGGNVRAFSVCPGLVATGMTNASLGGNWTATCDGIRKQPFGMDQYPCPYSAQQGAAVLMTSALTAKDNGAWYTRYFGCSDTRPVHEQGFTKEMRKQLYDKTLAWVGLTNEEIAV